MNDINQSNPANIDVISHSIDLFEKHLEILNEQKSVTSDAIDKTMLEGDTLLDYLKEINPKGEPNVAGGDTNKTEKQSNSYVHLEGPLNTHSSNYLIFQLINFYLLKE